MAWALDACLNDKMLIPQSLHLTCTRLTSTSLRAEVKST